MRIAFFLVALAAFAIFVCRVLPGDVFGNCFGGLLVSLCVIGLVGCGPPAGKKKDLPADEAEVGSQESEEEP